MLPSPIRVFGRIGKNKFAYFDAPAALGSTYAWLRSPLAPSLRYGAAGLLAGSGNRGIQRPMQTPRLFSLAAPQAFGFQRPAPKAAPCLVPPSASPDGLAPALREPPNGVSLRGSGNLRLPKACAFDHALFPFAAPAALRSACARAGSRRFPVAYPQIHGLSPRQLRKPAGPRYAPALVLLRGPRNPPVSSATPGATWRRLPSRAAEPSALCKRSASVSLHTGELGIYHSKNSQLIENQFIIQNS